MTQRRNIAIALAAGLAIASAAPAPAQDGHLWCLQSFLLKDRWDSKTTAASYPANLYAMLLDPNGSGAGLMVQLGMYIQSGTQFPTILQAVHAGPMRPAYVCPFLPTATNISAVTKQTTGMRGLWYLGSDVHYIDWTLPDDAPDGLDTVVLYFSTFNQCGEAILWVKQGAGSFTQQTETIDTYNASGGLLNEEDPLEATLDEDVGPGDTFRITREDGNRLYVQAVILYDADGLCTGAAGEHRWIPSDARVAVNLYNSAHEWVIRTKAVGAGDGTLQWVGSQHNNGSGDGANGLQTFTNTYAPDAETWTDGPYRTTSTDILGNAESEYGGYYTGDLRLHRDSTLNHTTAGNFGSAVEDYRIGSATLRFSMTGYLSQAMTVNTLYNGMFAAGNDTPATLVWLLTESAVHDAWTDSTSNINLGTDARTTLLLWDQADVAPIRFEQLQVQPAPDLVFLARTASPPRRKLFWRSIGTNTDKPAGWSWAGAWDLAPSTESGLAARHQVGNHGTFRSQGAQTTNHGAAAR